LARADKGLVPRVGFEPTAYRYEADHTRNM
jgi:hypothetical protein